MEGAKYITPAKIIGVKTMPEQIENAMVVDSWWDEIEYGVPSKARLRREREAYEQAENGDEDEFV